MNVLDRNTSTPWKNGYYHSSTEPSKLWLVDGENLVLHSASGTPSNTDNRIYKATWKFGDFGEAHPDVVKESGKSRYNVDMSMIGGHWCPKGVVSDDGTKVTHYGLGHCVDSFTWMSNEEVQQFKETGDPHDDMPHQYKEQPENQGKLIWLTGAPGLGKSTSGLLLARKANYVYYEADAFMNHANPYVSTDVDDPTIAMLSQNFLKGLPQERIDAVADGLDELIKMTEGAEYDMDKAWSFYKAISDDITKERKRIGGNFAIAQIVPKRAIRDRIRAHLGPELVFVVLDMSKEDQRDRILARHGDESILAIMERCYDVSERATDDEPNAINLFIKKDMSRAVSLVKRMR